MTESQRASIAPSAAGARISPLGRRVVRAMAWSVGSSIGSRAIGLVGTLVLTRYVAPAAYGEVAVAAVLVTTGQQLSTLGLGQYIVAKPDAGRVAAFHVTVYALTFGALALAAIAVAGPALSAVLGAPGASRFLAGLLLAATFDRVAFVPERILVRDLRFRVIGTARTAGELSYTASSLAFAIIGWGGMSIVIGNIVRSAVRCVGFLAFVKARDWLQPTRLNRDTSRSLFAFGLPLSVAALAAFGSRRWDNLLVSRFFGPGVAGTYNLAYNIADVPAIQIGEQVGDVLLPSFASMPADRRPAALERSLRLLGVLVFPLAVGLGAVADTLVAAIFDPRWRPVGPMLMVLAGLSVTRPIGWTLAGYMQAQGYPRAVMLLECLKLGVIIGAMVLLGASRPLWSCVAVGIGFAAHALGSCFALKRLDNLSVLRLLRSVARPLAACVPLVLVVLLVRWLLPAQSLGGPVGHLVLEVVLGAACYIATACWIAPETARELVRRARDAWPRRSHARSR